MTVYISWVSDTYGSCGKPAKWVSPEPIMGRIYELCGIHRNSTDHHYKKKNSDLRCKPLKPNTEDK